MVKIYKITYFCIFYDDYLGHYPLDMICFYIGYIK